MLLGLTACTKKFDEDDVKKYIRDDMHISSFRILSGPVDVKGEDGYTDEEWTVSTDVFDLGEDLVFHVYNDVYYSMEWTTNRLDDDLLYQKQLVLLANCDLPDGVTTEEVKDSSGRPWAVSLVYHLVNRADFANASSAITRLQPSFASIPGIKDTEFIFCLKVKETDPVTDARIVGREYSFNFNSMKSFNFFLNIKIFLFSNIYIICSCTWNISFFFTYFKRIVSFSLRHSIFWSCCFNF